MYTSIVKTGSDIYFSNDQAELVMPVSVLQKATIKKNGDSVWITYKMGEDTSVINLSLVEVTTPVVTSTAALVAAIIAMKGSSADYTVAIASPFEIDEVDTDTINEKTLNAGVTVDGALIKDGAFDTNVAAAGATLSGTTLAANGTDAAIPITITPKGVAGILTGAGSAAKPAYSFSLDADTGIINSAINSLGFVTAGTEQWLINSSGALNPLTDNAKNIGSVAVAPATIMAGTAFSLKGIDTNSKYGILARKYVTAKATLAGASTSIAVNVPSGAKVIAVQFAVPTLITSADGATSWKAKFATGSAAVLTTGQAFAANTKVNVHYSETTMAATAVMTGVTTILIEPNANTFSGGEISAIVYYEELTSITT